MRTFKTLSKRYYVLKDHLIVAGGGTKYKKSKEITLGDAHLYIDFPALNSFPIQLLFYKHVTARQLQFEALSLPFLKL